MTRCLIDTGVLLRLFDRNDPECQNCRMAIATLLSEGYELLASVQNTAEFMNVSTRPATARGGYGHSVEKALRRLRFLEGAGSVLSESDGSYSNWKTLVETYTVSGVAVHDARLVSVMIQEQLSHILTLNKNDFARYDQIVILTPADVIAQTDTPLE